MNKRERISQWLADATGEEVNPGQPEVEKHPYYRAFFRCWNEQQYYEAHDVLEQLWLNTKSPDEPGCVTYSFTRDLKDPDTFRFFECWEDDATFDTHCATPHYLDFTTRFLPKLTSVEATRFEIADSTKLA